MCFLFVLCCVWLCLIALDLPVLFIPVLMLVDTSDSSENDTSQEQNEAYLTQDADDNETVLGHQSRPRADDVCSPRGRPRGAVVVTPPPELNLSDSTDVVEQLEENTRARFAPVVFQ